MRPNWGAICVGGALSAVGVLGLEGGSARAQAAGGGVPAPIYGLPAPSNAGPVQSYAFPGTPTVPGASTAGVAAPWPVSAGAYPGPAAPGVGVSPARTLPSAIPTNPAAVGDGAALTSTAVPPMPGVAAGTPVAAPPADGHSSYFRSELPPSPPSRLERMRMRVRGFIHRNGGHENAAEHAYSDPSTGKTNQPISKPWLNPNR